LERVTRFELVASTLARFRLNPKTINKNNGFGD
jgi:hypothetical protein